MWTGYLCVGGGIAVVRIYVKIVYLMEFGYV